MIRTTQKTLAALLVAIALLCIAPASAFADGMQANPESAEKTGELDNPAPANNAPKPTEQTELVQNAPTEGTPESADGQGVTTQPSQEGAPQVTTHEDAKGSVQGTDGGTPTEPTIATASTPKLVASSESNPREMGNGTAAPPSLQAASTPAKASPSISYKAHVQNVGWQGAVSNGKTAGTSGQALRMEALTVTLNTGGYSGGLQMKAHVQNIGWQPVSVSGTTMGTSGKSLRMEAIRLALTGEISQYYDIFYRAHVQNIGWQDWVKNGQVAGTSGQALRVEAIQIELREKAKPASTQGDGLVSVRYQAHVQNVGWQGMRYDGATAGTSGQSLRVEAIRLWLEPGTLSGNIEYRVHVQNKGWMSWVKNGQVAGTTGKSLRVEALQIRLTGDFKDKYDVVYSGHVQNIGWQSSKNNEDVAGTTGRALRVEALQVTVVDRSQRTGWYKENGSWTYYSSGNKAAGRWVVTSESPIDANPGTQRYWVDTSGKLAVSRAIRPTNAADKGSYLAYATGSGYVMRNSVVELDNTFYWANDSGKLGTPNVSQLIENAVRWAINVANDDSHGYSQDVRWGPDYDCSSFVISAFKAAGFNVGNAVYTGNMKSELTKHGFVWSTNLSNLRRGDILLVHSNSRQHTELYLGNGLNVGAHIAETGGIYGRAGDQTGEEICIDDYYNAPWQGFLRAVLK